MDIDSYVNGWTDAQLDARIHRPTRVDPLKGPHGILCPATGCKTRERPMKLKAHFEAMHG